MSNPSFENIDKWLFEYMEGNLSPNQITQLESFLLSNPQYDADMDAWQLAKADATPMVYPGVAGRKRKPVPFWVGATLILTAVFVAGAFSGAYLSGTNRSNDYSVELAASTSPHYVATDKMVSYLNNQQKTNSQSSSNLGSNNSGWARNENFLSVVAANEASKTFTYQRNQQLTSNTGLNTLSKLTLESFEGKSSFVNNQRETESALTSTPSSDVSNTENSVIKSESEALLSDMNQENKKNQSPSSKKLEDKNKSEATISPDVTARTMTRGADRIVSNHERSLSRELKSAVRKIVRMTDNPIGLTNSKDVYYHVPGMQTLNVNAGTAGNLLRPRIQSITRAQWTGHSNQQMMNELSFDTYVKSIRGGIGVQLNHSYYNLGTYNVGQVALTYSPKFAVNRNFSIEPAVRVKMGDVRLDAQNLVQGQVIEMNRGNEKIFFNETPQNKIKDLWYKDVALALNTNTKWFSAGFQMDNLGRHHSNAFNSNGQNDRAGIHYTAHLSTDFVSKTKIISFSPYLMCQKVENLSEIWGGSIFRYKNLTIGGAYSSAGDYAGSIGLKTNLFMLTYNADMTSSYLTGTRLFSQQLTIRILMNKGYYGRTTLKQ